VRNCVTCHDPDNPRTPQAGQILTHPNIAACGSCHENVDFATGAGHSAANIVASNDACTACHSTGGIAGSALESHAIPTKLASERFQLNVLGLQRQADRALVTFSITNPADGSTYALPGSLRTLIARLNWTQGNSSDYGRPFPLSANALDSATPAGAGTYEVPIDIAPANAPVDPTLLTVSLEASAWLDGVQDGEIVRIAGVTRFFAPNGAADVVQRRQVVEDQACQSCHAQYEGPYSGHGQNRTDHIQMCVMCHNPSRTAPGSADNPREPHETSTDMMYMAHAIHASDIRGDNDYRSFGDLRYPRPSSDCLACHTSDTFQLTGIPRNKPAMATRVWEGEVAEERFVSPQSAACWSCHIGASAENHMSFFGGQINVPTAELQTPSQETCVGCHGPGRILDVRAVHPVR
jgi:OmcA/MtrC family decaheme c-type cytochrome